MQFRERYKNHYVALENIAPRYRMKTNKVYTQAIYQRGAASTHGATRRRSCNRFRELLIFTDDKSSIAIVERDNAEPRTEDEAGVESDEENMELLEGKFVRLTDLFPPLPKKGSLVVSDIKHSLILFSRRRVDLHYFVIFARSGISIY